VAVGVLVGKRVGEGGGVGLVAGDEVAVGLLWVAASGSVSGVGDITAVVVGVGGSSGEQPAEMSKIQEKRKIRFI
jgi:hypothetical protein